MSDPAAGTAPQDERDHAKLVHQQALAWALAQSRWTPEQRSKAENKTMTASLGGREAEVLGVPGHLWHGELTDIRHLVWNHRPPYETPPDATRQLRNAADSNWRHLRAYLQSSTGNIVFVMPGLWWVRDEWNSQPMETGWDEFRDAAEQAAATHGWNLREPAWRKCRYHLATGCNAIYDNYPAWYYHGERSLEHSGHAIALTDCPVCDQPYGSKNGRAQHLSLTHGIESHSQERIDLDATQTKELWDAREARQASLRQELQEPAPTAVQEWVAGKTPQRELDLLNEQAQQEPVLEFVIVPDTRHPAFEALAEVLHENDVLRRRVTELEIENAALGEDAGKFRAIRDMVN